MRNYIRVSLALTASLMLLGLCSAARPLDSIEIEDPSYYHLGTLSAAGLLGDYILPEESITRLEAAVLLSRGLRLYGEDLIAGLEKDELVEDAIRNLSEELGEEIALIAEPAALQSALDLIGPMAATAEGTAEVDFGPGRSKRAYVPVSSGGGEAPKKCGRGEGEGACKINPEQEEQIEEAEEPAEDEIDGEAAEAPAEPAVTVQMYGVAQLQVQGSDTSISPAGSASQDAVDVYWGELGWDASFADWTGHFSVALNDEDKTVDLYEAYVSNYNADSGGIFHMGRYIHPFGNNFFYSPTFPAANDLGATTANGLGAGVEKGSWGLGAWVYKSDVPIEGKPSKLNDYSVVWDISKRDADDCGPGWRLTAGYSSNLGAHDLRLAGEGPLGKRVGAVNLFGKYDWDSCECNPGGRWHLLADYIAATDEFAVADLDANGDGVGDKPSALNLELVHEPVPDQLYGLTFQSTSEMADYASSRFGLLYGERINDLVLLKILASHGEYGSFATGGQESDNSLVGELCLHF